jgi:hypothetical protein
MRSTHGWVRLALALLVATAPVGARAEETSSGEAEGMLGDFGIGLRFGYLRGDANGHLQTPRGGNPGTSTQNEPHLDEIGIEDFDAFDAALDLSWRQHHVDLGGQWMGLDGSATVGGVGFVSQGVPFLPGMRVHSDVDLDWYRLGYRYRFDVPLGDQHLFVAPGVQGVHLEYSYELQGELPSFNYLLAFGNPRADRSFPQAGMRLGGTLEWQPHPMVAIEGAGWWGVPIEETARILDVGVVGKLRVYQMERGPSAWVHIGVRYERIEFRDDQELENDIDVQLGPMLNAGIELRL